MLKTYFYITKYSSTEYYFFEGLKKAQDQFCEPVNNRDYEVITNLLEIHTKENFDLFIVRHIKLKDLQTIRSINNKLNNLLIFIDDDLFDFKAFKNLPIFYQLRLFLNFFLYKNILRNPKTLVAVSTKFLQYKYRAYSPILIKPANNKSYKISVKSFPNKSIRICYHGTWSHKNEIEWLIPIIREVQNHCPNTIFEIIGGDRVAKLFKGIPRVEVLDTMPWPQYLEHTSNVHQDIGLAPLMDTLFNRGRGPIKFFDYARAGAVGIYSKGPAFGDFVADGVDGFLLDNNPQLWVEKIVELVNNPELRQIMADKAWEKVLDNSPASQSVQDYLNGFQT